MSAAESATPEQIALRLPSGVQRGFAGARMLPVHHRARGLPTCGSHASSTKL